MRRMIFRWTVLLLFGRESLQAIEDGLQSGLGNYGYDYERGAKTLLKVVFPDHIVKRSNPPFYARDLKVGRK